MHSSSWAHALRDAALLPPKPGPPSQPHSRPTPQSPAPPHHTNPDPTHPHAKIHPTKFTPPAPPTRHEQRGAEAHVGTRHHPEQHGLPKGHGRLGGACIGGLRDGQAQPACLWGAARGLQTAARGAGQCAWQSAWTGWALALTAWYTAAGGSTPAIWTGPATWMGSETMTGCAAAVCAVSVTLLLAGAPLLTRGSGAAVAAMRVT